MISTRLYLDNRYIQQNGECPIKIQISKRGKTALLSTGIKVLPNQWDKDSLSIVRHPSKGVLNSRLQRIKLKVDEVINDLVLSGRAAFMTAQEVKDEVEGIFFGTSDVVTFGEVCDSFLKTKTTNTRKVFATSFKRIATFMPTINEKPIVSFGQKFAKELSAWLEENYSPSTRRITLTNVSSVFFFAINEGLITKNPIHGIKLGFVTTRKRNLSVEKFRKLWNAEPKDDNERRCLDFFKFSFLTIAMNPVDICKLTPSNIFNDRIDYVRSKTKKPYSIKIVDELLPLLDAYRQDGFLFRPFSRFPDYLQMISYIDHTIKKIGHRIGITENVTLYWVRHTWATMAAELDIPVDIIASCLGHSHGVKMTMVYIAIDQKKVDDAARRVIDYAINE